MRIPSNPIATALAKELGNPILTTSLPLVNDATLDDYARPESIALFLDGMASMMIDGGESGSVLSTVVDLTDSSSPQIIRQGAGQLTE